MILNPTEPEVIRKMKEVAKSYGYSCLAHKKNPKGTRVRSSQENWRLSIWKLKEYNFMEFAETFLALKAHLAELPYCQMWVGGGDPRGILKQHQEFNGKVFAITRGNRIWLSDRKRALLDSVKAIN